ncbi:hypothetical protein M2351_006971 [Azospirillum canadense]|nr:hypothetical protein [Azospirillum canadense]
MSALRDLLTISTVWAVASVGWLATVLPAH